MACLVGKESIEILGFPRGRHGKLSAPGPTQSRLVRWRAEDARKDRVMSCAGAVADISLAREGPSSDDRKDIQA